MAHRVEANQHDDGTWTIKVEGHDVSDAIASLMIQAHSGGKPASITMEILDPVYFTGKANVALTSASRQLMMALGWTPPRPTPGA